MNPLRKALVGAVIVRSTLSGGALGAALVSNAAGAESTTPAAQATSTTHASTTDGTTTDGTTTDGSTADRPDHDGPRDPSMGGHQANGITEELLTGDTATQVSDAAVAAVPGGTVDRVENDAEGATYEAHVTKEDGSQVTVKLDADFTVTSIEEGHG